MRKFYCYSSRLHRFFDFHKISPLYMFYNKKNKTFCWVYEGNLKLNELKDNMYPIERDKF